MVRSGEEWRGVVRSGEEWEVVRSCEGEWWGSGEGEW